MFCIPFAVSSGRNAVYRHPRARVYLSHRPFPDRTSVSLTLPPFLGPIDIGQRFFSYGQCMATSI